MACSQSPADMSGIGECCKLGEVGKVGSPEHHRQDSQERHK